MRKYIHINIYTYKYICHPRRMNKCSLVTRGLAGLAGGLIDTGFVDTGTAGAGGAGVAGNGGTVSRETGSTKLSCSTKYGFTGLVASVNTTLSAAGWFSAIAVTSMGFCASNTDLKYSFGSVIHCTFVNSADVKSLFVHSAIFVGLTLV